MRFEGPLYEGDSIIRSGPAFSDNPEVARKEPADKVEMVQRDIRDLDMYEIEVEARAMRAAAVAEWTSKLAQRFSQWLESVRRTQAEEYLARAQTHAELEARMRELERRGYVPHL